MAEETPLISQYLSIKASHPNEVLFFRLGDFYEMFNEDAVEVSRLLNLTLTHRGTSPMCGIPYHAAKVYIARLLRLGKKIAIAEQVGEIAHGKGLTERKVVEIITPGTACETEYLDGGRNNFLASLYVSKGKCGYAFIDVTTGEFKATSFDEKELESAFAKEADRSVPRELILSESLKNRKELMPVLSRLGNISVSYYPDWNFNAELSYKRLLKQFGTQNLKAFSLDENSPEVAPAGFLLDYVEKTTNSLSPHIQSISVYKDSEYVMMDDSSRRNLEITGNLRDGTASFTLLECVNFSKTAMGSRMIRDWLNFPLTDINLIKTRQNHITYFVNDRLLQKRVAEKLSSILDVERLASRIAMERAHAKDLQALKQSLIHWLKAQEALGTFNFAHENPETALNIINLIESSILDEPSTSLTEGGIIKEGWSNELDHWRDVQNNFQKILDDYVEEEKQITGIQNLRIRSNGNMGYFIEVTKGKLDKVPEHFIMRRALVNADRYTTERLQDLEQSLNESGTKILELERDLFVEIRSKIKEFVPYLLKTAGEIAYTDTCLSMAEAACVHGWVCPEMVEENIFNVKDGRHPVVENHIPKGEFVPNDLVLCSNEEEYRTFALITGPNMAGKSTFLRQNALIALLAQTGSYVPCTSATLGIVDRIFCRVGASDNLARGESTFLVEMTETANILRCATEKSLVIMDEVGRGTSTEDGLSIAWAVSEYLLNNLRCKTLFATHYHELTRMEHNNLCKLCMAVNDSGNDVVFLRKVIFGESANSYGIHVARLAGIPSSVIDRASVILSKIQDEAISGDITVETKNTPEPETKKSGSALSLFSEEDMVLNELLSMDVNNITPLKALEAITRWKNELSGQ